MKSSLINDKNIINEWVTVDDDTNVSKAVIDNHIASLLGKKINKFGQGTWHQNFSEQHYRITDNAITGNYQKAKAVMITIVGKEQLQDTIEFQIYVQCYNQSDNEKIFKSNNFNVNYLKPIALYPNVLPTGVIHLITFKNDADSLPSLLYADAVKDLNTFLPTKNIGLEMNIGINLDGDNYQINCQQEIDANVIKKINNIVLVSDSEQIGKYQHLKALDIIIKYDNNQEYKIPKTLDVNIKSNILTFINFNAIVVITS